MRNFKDRVRLIPSLTLEVREELWVAMNRLIWCKSQSVFRSTYGQIGRQNFELYAYLQRNWLDCSDNWATCFRGKQLNFGNGTNNRVESANRYIKMGLSCSSSLFDCVLAIAKRNRRLDAQFYHKTVQEQIRPLDRRFSSEAFLRLLCRFTAYARRLIATEYCGVPP